MTCWAVIPVKPPPERKSRLAATLDAGRRDALVLRMARHVAEAASRTEGIDRVAFVARGAEGLPEGFEVLPDAGGGLNAAVAGAFARLAGASRVIVIAGDLPLVTPEELKALAIAGAGTAVIAPDRHGTGTNALSLPLPAASGFKFAFGPGSYAKHCDAIRQSELEMAVVRRDGLARDIDEPADLGDAAALIGQ